MTILSIDQSDSVLSIFSTCGGTGVSVCPYVGNVCRTLRRSSAQAFLLPLSRTDIYKYSLTEIPPKRVTTCYLKWDSSRLSFLLHRTQTYLRQEQGPTSPTPISIRQSSHWGLSPLKWHLVPPKETFWQALRVQVDLPPRRQELRGSWNVEGIHQWSDDRKNKQNGWNSLIVNKLSF